MPALERDWLQAKLLVVSGAVFGQLPLLGLVAILHPWETGSDNSPGTTRWSDLLVCEHLAATALGGYSWELAGQVWWAAPDGSPPPDVWLKRAALFVEHARIAHQRAPGFEATWFAGTDTNTSFGYPHLPTARIVQAVSAG